MHESDNIYIELQKHLDKQAIGFPSTRSRCKIRVLKHIFTPEEAKIATFLTCKHEPIEIFYTRVRHVVGSPSGLEKMLLRLQKKGGIESRTENGIRLYC